MIDKLDDISVIISIIQVVSGGIVISIFKLWLLKEDELNKTVALRKERKFEEVCESLQNLYDRFNSDIPLRGDGGKHSDVALSFVKRVITVIGELEQLKRTKRTFNNLNTYLICTSLLGVLFLIIALCINSHYFIISFASIFVIISQIFVFIIIRIKGNEVNKFDDL